MNSYIILRNYGGNFMNEHMSAPKAASTLQQELY